jgi:replicative DNA helicase
MLSSEDFYEESHAQIFDVIRSLFEKNKAIDIITVKEKLDSKKLLDKIGGFNYLAELTEIVPTSANIYEYAQIVKNKAVLRKLIKA